MSARRTEQEIMDASPLSGIIRKSRKKLGLTQDQLAARVGVSIGFYRKLEGGETSLQFAKILRVLSFLNVDMTFVENNKEEPRVEADS
ncbi:helix-turn-helix domain-containing protein [bacterium]|nr:helix-turn-helix domain-containing protein [bacterium]